MGFRDEEVRHQGNKTTDKVSHPDSKRRYIKTKSWDFLWTPSVKITDINDDIKDIPKPCPNLSKKAVKPTSLLHFSPWCSASWLLVAVVVNSSPLSFTSTSRKHCATAWHALSSTPTGPRISATSRSISPAQLRLTRNAVWDWEYR